MLYIILQRKKQDQVTFDILPDLSSKLGLKIELDIQKIDFVWQKFYLAYILFT